MQPDIVMHPLNIRLECGRSNQNQNQKDLFKVGTFYNDTT